MSVLMGGGIGSEHVRAYCTPVRPGVEQLVLRVHPRRSENTWKSLRDGRIAAPHDARSSIAKATKAPTQALHDHPARRVEFARPV